MGVLAAVARSYHLGPKLDHSSPLPKHIINCQIRNISGFYIKKKKKTEEVKRNFFPKHEVIEVPSLFSKSALKRCLPSRRLRSLHIIRCFRKIVPESYSIRKQERDDSHVQSNGWGR